MDTLASLAAAAAVHHQQQQANNAVMDGEDVEDEFDAITPMQLDQPPPPLAPQTTAAAATMQQNDVSCTFYGNNNNATAATANCNNTTIMAQQQQQNGFFSSPLIQQQQSAPTGGHHHHPPSPHHHSPYSNHIQHHHHQQQQQQFATANHLHQQQMPEQQHFGTNTFLDTSHHQQQQQQHWLHPQQQQQKNHLPSFTTTLQHSPHHPQSSSLNNNNNWQIPPIRKESMPALHLQPVEHHHHHQQQQQQHPSPSHHCAQSSYVQQQPAGSENGSGGGSTVYGNYAQRILGIDHHQQQRTRSLSTAIFPCSAVSPTSTPTRTAQHHHYQQQQQQQQQHDQQQLHLNNDGHHQQQQQIFHSPTSNMFDAHHHQGQWHQQQQQLVMVEQRRTKSTIVPPTSLNLLSPFDTSYQQQQQQLDDQYGNANSNNSNYSPHQQSQQQQLHANGNVAAVSPSLPPPPHPPQLQRQSPPSPPHRSTSIVHSLRRFSSQLRSPCRSYSTTIGIAGCNPSDGAENANNNNGPTAAAADGRSAMFSPGGSSAAAAFAPLTAALLPLQLKPYTPPPILSPMRQGSGLFSRINGAAQQKERKPSSLALCIGNNNALVEEKFERQKYIKDMVVEQMVLTNGVGLEEMAADEEENNNNQRKKTLPNGINGKIIMEEMHAEDPMGADEPCERPQRKNGTILFAAEGPSSSGLSFAAELEQLRKQSSVSYRSHKASMYGNRMSIRHGKLSLANEDFIRKMSTVSMEEQEAEDGEKPPESDSIPHINLGKNYQARVKKWADRAILAHERNAIPDRDEQMFSAHCIEHIPQQVLAAYETLSCSVALPKPGRNKELALHILAENQGNLQAAVMDLLRCDTLDWEQYQAVYNSRYVDVDAWSPEEINMFQDAIYKSEKDFPQVAAELGNRSVQECVAFYYTWKKACPDDYRKLRNLRRKRQLLEQQLDLTSFDHQQNTKTREEASSEDEGEEERDFSETESDITTHSLGGCGAYQSMEYSPDQQRKYSHPSFNPISVSAVQPPLSDNNPLASLLAPAAAAAAVHNGQTQNQLFSGGHPNGATTTGFPWLHGTDGIFPSPSSSSTSTNDNNQNALFDATSQFGGASSIGNVENGGRMTHNGGYSAKIRHSVHHHHASSAAIKKGAQPQADGFFHCRLCEKRFEKVKSLNAHMKSHAMKARAEAEAQQKQLQQSHQLNFPLPIKKEQSFIAGHDKTSSQNPLDVLAVSTALNGMPGLTSQAQAAMAALNTLGRQIQQQATSQQQTSPFSAVGANTGFGLLRNMLQYGQQHVNGMAPTTGAGGGTWPPSGLEQHFNT